jgi:hypothetical protein
MIKTNELFNLKAFKALKTFLPCYGVISDSRFFDSELRHFKTYCAFDFGFKHQYKTLAVNQSNLSIHKIKDFETPYNEILTEFECFKRFNAHNQLFLVLMQNFDSKHFVKGRLLNISKRGCLVGVCGVVGFLPLNSGIKVNDDKTIVIYVESMNVNRKIVSFAQKPIFKKAQKVFFKLSSRLFFNFESNSKYI